MQSLLFVWQLLAFAVAGSVARVVYCDRIYFKPDDEQAGEPTTVPPWMTQQVEPLGPTPSPSRFPPRGPSASRVPPQAPPSESFASSQPSEGFIPLDTKVEPSPEPSGWTTVTTPEPTTSLKPYVPGLLDQAVNSLTLKMETILDGGTGALVFSPLSITGVLSLILLGAGGETRNEIAETLGVKAGVRFAQDGTDLVHHDIANYYKRFESSATGLTVRFASGVFLQEDVNVQERFERNLVQLYGSELQRVNFRHDAVINPMQTINDWVCNRTEGHLKKILSDPLPAETTAVFVNVIYFKGEWEHPFCTDCGRVNNFYVSPEETVRVKMMTAVNPAYFNEDKIKGYKILGVPYKSSDLVMYFILPKTNPKEFLEGIKVDDLTSMVENAPMRKEVIYLVPRMKLESTLELEKPLKKLGLKSMFSRRADLRGISEGIWIDSVLQKVEIELTETGTTAVVSTIASTTRSGKFSMRLDKPFIFMVYNRALRTIVFWGTVYKPTPFEQMPLPA